MGDRSRRSKNYDRGVDAKESGNFKEALALFKKAAAAAPDHAEAHHNVGACLLLLRDPAAAEAPLQNAIAAYNRRLESDDTDDEAWYWMAAAFALLKKKRLSLNSLAHAIQLNEDWKEEARSEEDFQAYTKDRDFIRLTKEETKEARARRLVRELKAKNVKWKTTAGLKFYLGEVVASKFFIPAKKLPTAHRRVLEGARADLDKDDYKELAKHKTLHECLEADCMGLLMDEEGNAVGVDQGGDLWADYLLKYIPDLVRTGSYFLIRDDTGRFWKIAFEKGKMSYLKADAK